MQVDGTERAVTTVRLVRTRAALVVLVGVAALAAAGCGGGVDVQASSKRSNPRPEPSTSAAPGTVPDAGTVPPGTGGTDVAAFCDRLRAAAALPPTDDPAEAVRRFSDLAADAPEPVAKDLQAMAGAVQRLDALPKGSPDAAGEAIGILLDPAVLRAGVAVENWARTNCGLEIDPDPAPGSGDSAGAGEDPAPAPGDISLEDIDAVKEANAGRSWPDRINSTTIVNDTDVQLSAGRSDLSAPEALEACEAVRVALVPKNPKVVVSILNGSRTVAASPAGGTCAVT